MCWHLDKLVSSLCIEKFKNKQTTKHMKAFLHKSLEGPQGPESPSKDQAESPEDVKMPPTLPGGCRLSIRICWVCAGCNAEPCTLILLLPVSQAVSAKAFFSASCFSLPTFSWQNHIFAVLVLCGEISLPYGRALRNKASFLKKNKSSPLR